MRPNRSCSGFTLIELMMVLIVLGIIMSIAVPSFRTMFANNQSISVSEDFIAALNLARSEAVKRGKLVSVCRTTNGATCAAATGDWNTGFMVYVDSTASETTNNTAIAADGILRVYPSLVSNGGAIAVTQNSNPVIFLRYTAMGTLAKNVNAEAKVTTSVSKCKGNNKRVATVKLSGSISVAKLACS